MSARIVVLASGGGTNCQALIDACQTGDIDGDVVAVISNNENAGVLERARSAEIPAVVVDHTGRDPDVRLAADRALILSIRSHAPDLVVLAGWMRILGAEVGAAFPVINLHPAKPGAFPGTRAIERAYEAWADGAIDSSGVMVHWVPDDGVDVGPVILTEDVPFEPGDSVASFAERMHAAEHRVIVAATAQALGEGS